MTKIENQIISIIKKIPDTENLSEQAILLSALSYSAEKIGKIGLEKIRSVLINSQKVDSGMIMDKFFSNVYSAKLLSISITSLCNDIITNTKNILNCLVDKTNKEFISVLPTLISILFNNYESKLADGDIRINSFLYNENPRGGEFQNKTRDIDSFISQFYFKMKETKTPSKFILKRYFSCFENFLNLLVLDYKDLKINFSLSLMLFQSETGLFETFFKKIVFFDILDSFIFKDYKNIEISDFYEDFKNCNEILNNNPENDKDLLNIVLEYNPLETYFKETILEYLTDYDKSEQSESDDTNNQYKKEPIFDDYDWDDIIEDDEDSEKYMDNFVNNPPLYNFDIIQF